MKNKNVAYVLLAVFLAAVCAACSSHDQSSTESKGVPIGQANVQDTVSARNIVQVASGSKDHTTLVAAVKAAELVDVLSNAGPFTVFAPTNAAFEKLPKGTVESLLKPEKKEVLADILQYHVSVGVYQAKNFKDGQIINQVNSDNVTMGVKDGKITVNGANIVASIPTANGVIHVIDAVLLPPAKK